MDDNFRSIFSNNASIEEREGLFYQKGLTLQSPFEQRYTKLRKSEGRLYSDDTVKRLPDFNSDGPQRFQLIAEWKIRKHSANALVHYLKKYAGKKIIEVGCGNGWLVNTIHDKLKSPCCGIDVNETELRQAAELFGRGKNLVFLHADVTSNLFEEPIADIIIVASAIQYFPKLNELLKKFCELLHSGGSIHIIDSPFYNSREVNNAQKRSANYFAKSGNPEMSHHYFHHSLDDLSGFDFELLHDPTSLVNKISRPFKVTSPFPWILIRKS